MHKPLVNGTLRSCNLVTLISSCEIHTTIKPMAAWPSFQLISSLQMCYNQNSIWSYYIANNDLWTTEDGHQFRYFPWASCQIRKFAGCAYAGNSGNVFPATDFNGNRQLAIPACITARASRSCRDACRDRLPTMAGKTFPVFYVYGKRPIAAIENDLMDVL